LALQEGLPKQAPFQVTTPLLQHYLQTSKTSKLKVLLGKQKLFK